VDQKGISTLENISTPEKMRWLYIKSIGHCLKNLDPSQKIPRPSWCPNLVTGLKDARNYFHSAMFEETVVFNFDFKLALTVLNGICVLG